MLEALPLEVSELGNFEARMLRNFRAAVEDWDEVCSSLGKWEADHFTAAGFQESKNIHQKWTSELIAWGELVLQATQHPAFPQRDLANRVSQRLTHLRDKLSLWHGEMSAEDEDRILRAAFS